MSLRWPACAANSATASEGSSGSRSPSLRRVRSATGRIARRSRRTPVRLTTTSAGRSPGSTARCDWVKGPTRTGASSKRTKRRSSVLPSSRSTRARSSAGAIGFAVTSERPSSSATFGGIRSRRTERKRPSSPNVGPSSSSERRNLMPTLPCCALRRGKKRLPNTKPKP
jgi:hypothetical protein